MTPSFSVFLSREGWREKAWENVGPLDICRSSSFCLIGNIREGTRQHFFSRGIGRRRKQNVKDQIKIRFLVGNYHFWQGVWWGDT